MLTRDEIRQKLLENPMWEPEQEVSDEDWALYEEVKDEMREAGELRGQTTGDMTGEGDDDDWDGDGDDDDDWDGDDDDNN